MFMNDEVLGNVIMDVLEIWSDRKKARKDYERTHKNNDEKPRSRRITTIIECSDDEY